MRKSAFIMSVLLSILGSSLVAQQPQGVKIDTTSSSSKDDWSTSRNAIKLNPPLFLRGDIPLYFEKNITSKLSVEVGVGMTTADYIGVAFDIDSLNIDGIKSNLGYSFDAGIRYYASDYAFEPEGLFFGLDYRHQRYNATIDGEAYKRTNNDFRVIIGNITNFAENAFWEPYMGLGIRQRNSSLDGDTRLDDLVPYFSCGLKIGIYFNTAY